MNIKKMFTALSAMVVAVTMIPGLTALAATPDTELGQAYEWAYANGITTMDSYEAANMTAPISRAQMAKMLSVYATKILGMTPDTSKDCTFSDIASVQGDLHDYIIESCQLGLMGQGITAFRPYDLIPRSEFGTALSRTLWGETYNGGTPFYAKHLDALKEAKIMTKIANAENTNEIRGYVMIMLQRAAEAGIDCDDTDVVLACLDDINNCPAACKAAYDDEDSSDTETVVKSGDLDVTISNASNGSIVHKGTADLDTIKFRTSEEVTISKVTLERYGYSSNEDIVEVWLEDEDGNVLTEPKSLNSKGFVTLSLKKDYKSVDGLLNATIVIKTNSKAGKTIGFKVTDVESSAKNLNLSNYTPYAYSVVEYDGATVVLSAKSTEKEYNFEAGKSYEIAKFKVKAPTDGAINVKGFTLTNNGNLDEEEWIEDVTVTVAGKDVDASYKLNKDKELVVNFKKEVELEAKANVEVVVEATLADDFDEYGSIAQFYVKETADFNATEVKTSSRVTVTGYGTPAGWPQYTFKGGKVRVTNTKLGTVESPINSEDVVIAEGKIETSEEIKGNLYVTVKGESMGALSPLTGSAWAIEGIRVSVNGDETEGKPVDSTNDATAAEKTLVKADYAGDVIYKFSNVEIDEDATFQILVDIRDDANYSEQSLSFAFAGFKNYMKYVADKKAVDVAGSISTSKLNIQAAKASLTNTLSKTVDFKSNEVSRHEVFNGTYTAKKGTVKLNEFYIKSSKKTTEYNPTLANLANDVTFYLSIDGKEVADVTLGTTTGTTDVYYLSSDTFGDVEVAAGESVSVVLEAEVDAKNKTGDLGRYTLALKGEDNNGNEAGVASKLSVQMKVVTAGTVNVSATTQKNTVLLRKANASIANFSVKSSNSSEVDIDDVTFTIRGLTRNTITADDITFTIGGVEVDGNRVGAPVQDNYELAFTIDSNSYYSPATAGTWTTLYDDAGVVLPTHDRYTKGTTFTANTEYYGENGSLVIDDIDYYAEGSNTVAAAYTAGKYYTTTATAGQTTPAFTLVADQALYAVATTYTAGVDYYSVQSSTMTLDIYSWEELYTVAPTPYGAGTYYRNGAAQFTIGGATTYYTKGTDGTYSSHTAPLAAGTYYTQTSTTTYAATFTYETTESVKDAKTFEISLEEDQDAVGTIIVDGLVINSKDFSNTFTKRFESALVSFDSQEDKDGSTRFVLGVDTFEDEEVSNVKLYADYTSKLCSSPVSLGSNSYCLIYDGTATITDGDDIEVTNNYDGGNSYFVTAIQYTVSNSDAAGNGVKTIKKVDYNDYFKVGSESAKVYKND